MKEIKEIVAAYEKASKEGLQSALVTLVHVDGSSYRRPGARMLVTETGELTGAISGGCLEGDALNKALHAIHQQKNILVTYDTTDEDDAVLGLGLGCNGVIQVLIQPLQRSETPVALLKKVTASRKENILVTLFSLNERRADHPGTCVCFDGEKIEYLKEISPEIAAALNEDMATAMREQRTLFKNYCSGTTDATAYIEYIPPVASLVIAGTGNDAEPVVQMASMLGWEVTLIDDGRDRNTKTGRFAGACTVKAARPESAFDDLKIDQYTFFILMTHNYNYDLAMLRLLLKRNARYIGVLGPRKKMDRMLGELRSEGFHPAKEQLMAIYSPVGMDIGAESPEEIALSIVAEIKAVMSERSGQPLRDGQDVIHPRGETIIEQRDFLAQK
ncbi:MAG: XdhC family protein [Chitinophagaceae bacterium]|nr:XdhC family protein [Chitinophagaceae bacterium]